MKEPRYHVKMEHGTANVGFYLRIMQRQSQEREFSQTKLITKEQMRELQELIDSQREKRRELATAMRVLDDAVREKWKNINEKKE